MEQETSLEQSLLLKYFDQAKGFMLKSPTEAYLKSLTQHLGQENIWVRQIRHNSDGQDTIVSEFDGRPPIGYKTIDCYTDTLATATRQASNYRIVLEVRNTATAFYQRLDRHAPTGVDRLVVTIEQDQRIHSGVRIRPCTDGFLAPLGEVHRMRLFLEWCDELRSLDRPY
jgi:hypothetical protein